MIGSLAEKGFNNMSKTVKVTQFSNRFTVAFSIEGFGNELVTKANQISAIFQKHNIQTDSFHELRSHLLFDPKGQATGFQDGQRGGVVVIHNSLCDSEKALSELIDCISTFEKVSVERYKEEVRTHKADGTAYKQPQFFTVKA